MTKEELEELENLARPVVNFLKKIDGSGYTTIVVEIEHIKVVQEIAGTPVT